MSFSDQADDVRPDSGEGDGGASDAPYAEYLNRIPEEYRAEVEPAFKEWDGQVTRRFQEAAEFRKQWEPFQDTGVHEMQPDEVKWALQVAEAAQNNPAALREWLDQNHPVEAPQQDYGTTYDQYADPNAQTIQQLQQQLERVQQQLQQGDQRWQDFELQTQHARDAAIMEAEIAAIKEAHGSELPPKVLEDFDDLMITFGGKHAVPGADPKQVVAKTWADIQRYFNAVEANALNRKVNDPNPAEGGGMPDVNPDKLQYGKAVESQAAELLRGWNRQARGQHQ